MILAAGLRRIPGVPETDGNGRMSRLLTLLLLYKSGYSVGKYISIEKQIEKTKDCLRWQR